MSAAPAEGPRPSPAPLWAALAAGACLLFWIANGAAVFDGEKNDAWHHYEYLVDGFLSGQTSLSVEPAPELLRLRDPYDPSQNGPWRLWDASLFRGRYYLYFGPTPVLLMLPWKVLTGHHLPERVAVACFAALGLLALALLVDGARRKHFPSVGGFASAAILLAALFASWLPVTLRRPDVWELPLVAAVACLWWALYCLWRCLGAEHGGRWALGAGAALALLLGSRPTGIGAVAVVLLLLVEPRRLLSRRSLLAGAVVLAGGLALLAYNHARFGQWLEFGQRYQLWGSDERNVRHFSLSYFPYNAWLYLLSVPSLSPYFPFVLAVPPGGDPPGYLGIDEMHGALLALPVQMAAAVALAWAWANRRSPAAFALRRTIWAAALASLTSALVLFCFAGATSRYMTEVFAGSTAAAALGLLALAGGFPRGRPGNVLRLLAFCAGTWTAAYVALASAEHRILFRKTNPRVYAALARFFDHPSLWAARREGVAFGPVELAVRIDPRSPPAPTVLLSSGRPGMMNQLILERPDRAHARLVLAENVFSVVASTPVFEVREGAFRARVDAPWLYPPVPSPWWDSVADPALRRDLQTRFSIEAAGATTTEHTPRFFEPTRFAPWVTGRGPGTGAWVESIGALPVPAR
jgi:hypothetical protein